MHDVMLCYRQVSLLRPMPQPIIDESVIQSVKFVQEACIGGYRRLIEEKYRTPAMRVLLRMQITDKAMMTNDIARRIFSYLVVPDMIALGKILPYQPYHPNFDANVLFPIFEPM